MTLHGPPQDRAGFPVRAVAGEKVWRFVREPYREDPWYFGRAGGRFDLTAEHAHGTCYVATARLAAVAEAGIRDAVAEERLIESTRFTGAGLRELTVPERHPQVADLAAAAAFGYGVTRELSTCESFGYPVTRAWASAFHGDGHGGIHYELRHPPDGDGHALFAAAGSQPWDRGTLHHFDDQLLNEVGAHYHIRIVPPGTAAEFTIIDGLDQLDG